MLGHTIPLRRLPVALFNMKHFQTKTKYMVTPDNFQELFRTKLHPQDRMLRQSSVGGGSTRVLVLDKMQGVKCVYHPLLCLPHPAVVDGGDTSLGLPVGKYLESLDARAHMAEVLTLVAHPDGIAFGTFTADGNVGLPLVNLAATSGAEALMDELLVAMSTPTAAAHLSRCTTYYYVRRDEKSTLTLATLQQHEKQVGARASSSPVSFNDAKWVSLPDVSLQTGREELISLYARDAVSKARIVSQEGLKTSVNKGKVEFDTYVGKKPAAESSPDQASP